MNATNPDSPATVLNRQRPATDTKNVILQTADTVLATDNALNIPCLNYSLQADAVDLPLIGWGTIRRKSTMKGTYHFYVDDSRFKALWENPHDVIASNCVSAIEPNFSIFNNTPRAVAQYRIYQKRWLARIWQNSGIRIFVDMNVSPEYLQDNLLGVPEGWLAYSTRGYSDRIEQLELELDTAMNHALTKNILFVVYGGGRNIQEFCYKNKLIHFKDRLTVIHHGQK